MHCLLILPLTCSYMWDLVSKTHIWCISGFVLKIGYYITLLSCTLIGEIRCTPYTTGIRLFVECLMVCRVFFSGTRQRASLPSAKEKTLGKKKHSAKRVLCRVSKKHSACWVPSVFFFDTRQSTIFAECFFDTRQRPSLPSAKKETLGKENFKSKFEALSKFKSKSFELQSCITSQDL